MQRTQEMSTEWTDAQLEEMVGPDRIDQLAWLAGCHTHRFINDREIPDGFIIPDQVLRQFALSIVRECILVARKADNEDEVYAWYAISQYFGVER